MVTLAVTKKLVTMNLEKASVVYVIENATAGIRKIGISQDVHARMKTLQCAGGCLLELKYTTRPLLRFYCEKLEKRLHELFDADRTYGEWFTTDLASIVEKLEQVGSDVKVPLDYELLCQGKSVAYIANHFDVSRAAVFKRVKGMNVPYDDLKQKMEEAKKDPKIPATLNRMANDFKGTEGGSYGESLVVRGKFERVSAGIYTNGNCFKAQKYRDGRMREKFFETLLEAEQHLSDLEK